MRLFNTLVSALAALLLLAAAAQAEQITAPIGGGLSVEIWTPEEAQTEPVTANAFGATIPAKPANPFLKLFQPKKKVQLKPVILYVHGGGWIRGTRDKVYNLPAYAAARDYILVSTDYRPVPRTNIDGQLADVTRAVAWTQKNIANYGGDPKRIVIMGHSAGAHLVALAAARGKVPGIRGVIANDVQAYDMVQYAALRGSIDGVYLRAFGNSKSNWVRWSPITYVRKGGRLPPHLVMYSNSHRPRRATISVAYAQELKSRGTPVTLYNGARYTHGSIARGIGTSGEVTGVIDRFLKGVFR